jgi:hypothetical protein
LSSLPNHFAHESVPNCFLSAPKENCFAYGPVSSDKVHCLSLVVPTNSFTLLNAAGRAANADHPPV